MGEAQQYLVEPAEPDDSITNGFLNPTDVFNYLSPSAWINDVIERVSGVDIFGYATDTLTGEWGSLWKFGDSLQNLAQSLQEIGINIQTAAIKMDTGWDGNAADSANAYFTSLASAVSGQQAALYAAAESYHKAAQGAWMLSGQIGNLLQAIVDKAIIVGIAAAAGTATIESGVGAVVGYGVAALEAVDLLNKVNNASKIINTAGTVIMGSFGAVADFAGQGGDLSAIPLPATPYALPAA